MAADRDPNPIDAPNMERPECYAESQVTVNVPSPVVGALAKSAQYSHADPSGNVTGVPLVRLISVDKDAQTERWPNPSVME